MAKTEDKPVKKAVKKVAKKAAKKVTAKKTTERPQKEDKPKSKVKSGGRKKGTPNKKSEVLNEILVSLEFDPLVEIIKALKAPSFTPKEIDEAYDKFVEDVDCEDDEWVSYRDFSNRIRDNEITIQEKIRHNFKLLKYIYPTKKAIEIKTVDKTVKTFSMSYSNDPADLDQSFLDGE